MGDDGGGMAMIAGYYASLIPPDCNSARNWIEKAITAWGRTCEAIPFDQGFTVGVDGKSRQGAFPERGSALPGGGRGGRSPSKMAKKLGSIR